MHATTVKPGQIEQIVYHPAHFLGAFLNAFQPELSLGH
jgi:hypothetical protein